MCLSISPKQQVLNSTVQDTYAASLTMRSINHVRVLYVAKNKPVPLMNDHMIHFIIEKHIASDSIKHYRSMLP